MKRFLIFNFPAYEGTDLDYSIQGMTDRLDSITERIESLDDVMALDMRTGFIWQYYPGAAEWKCGSNISKYPDLDAPPLPERQEGEVAKFYREFLAKEVSGGWLCPPDLKEQLIDRMLERSFP